MADPWVSVWVNNNPYSTLLLLELFELELLLFELFVLLLIFLFLFDVGYAGFYFYFYSFCSAMLVFSYFILLEFLLGDDICYCFCSFFEIFYCFKGDDFTGEDCYLNSIETYLDFYFGFSFYYFCSFGKTFCFVTYFDKFAAWFNKNYNEFVSG